MKYEAPALSQRLICPECKEVRIETPSGAVCPQGHGRVQMGVTTAELLYARRQVWQNALPEAVKITKIKDRPAYGIVGQLGVYFN